MKCHNCNNNAMFEIGPNGQFPVCLSCYTLHEQTNSSRMQTSLQLMNYMGQSIAFTLGMGSPPRMPQKSTHTGVAILNNNNQNNFTNNSIGFLNFGKVEAETINTTASNINSMRSQLDDAMKKLIFEVRGNLEIGNDIKNSLLESLSFICEEISKPFQQRRVSPIMNVIEGVEKLAGIANKIQVLWHTCHPLILALIGGGLGS